MRMPNGYGGVSKLSGKRRNPWIVRVTTDIIPDPDNPGKIKQIKKVLGYYPTRTAAIEALADYNKNPYSIDTASATFAEIYDKWSSEKYPKISHSNVNGYKASYKLCDKLYNMPFKDIRTSHMQAVVDNCGKAYPTLRKLRVFFNQLYTYAMANDVVAKNYADYVDIGKDDTDTDRAPFSEAEIQLLWDNVDRMPYIDTVLIMIYSGWRIGELLTIKTADVDLQELTMRGGIKTAAGKNRIVPIHPKIEPLIRKWYAIGAETLITKPNSMEPVNYYTYRDTYFRNICTQLQISHRPHDCRHTFATLADNAGANKLSIKRIMGHASSDITDKVYTHKDVAELRKAILMID